MSVDLRKIEERPDLDYDLSEVLKRIDLKIAGRAEILTFIELSEPSNNLENVWTKFIQSKPENDELIWLLESTTLKTEWIRTRAAEILMKKDLTQLEYTYIILMCDDRNVRFKSYNKMKEQVKKIKDTDLGQKDIELGKEKPIENKE